MLQITSIGFKANFGAVMKSFISCMFLILQVAAAATLASSASPPGNHINPPPVHYEADWQGWGGSIYNNRWASTNSDISSHSISNLTTNCQIPYVGGVSATPTLHNGIAYYPTWGGLYVALDYESCTVKWEVNVTAIVVGYKAPSPLQIAITSNPLEANPLSSRSSAQIDEEQNVLYFTTLLHALAVAVDLDDGTFLHVIQINPHETAIATLSPTLYRGILYAGTSSIEEVAAGVYPGYECCSFVGNVVALKFNRRSAQWITVWNVPTLPVDGGGSGVAGWAGGGVWGSQPPIDPLRKRVFFATGNTYHTPPEYVHCTDEVFDPANATVNSKCFPDRIWQNAVIALDLLSGTVAWVKRFGPADVWVVACGGFTQPDKDPQECPGRPGPDYDFGMAPNFIPGSKGAKDILTVGQKSGLLYGIAATNGEPLWSTVTNPGSFQGGLTWGIATDNERVYFTGVNAQGLPWALLPENATVVHKGLWGAADAKDGKLLWEVAVPNDQYTVAPPTVVGDLVLYARLSNFGFPAVGDGGLVVLDKATGTTLLDYPVQGAFRGGMAVQDGYILFGTGYKSGDGYLYVLKV